LENQYQEEKYGKLNYKTVDAIKERGNLSLSRTFKGMAKQMKNGEVRRGEKSSKSSFISQRDKH